MTQEFHISITPVGDRDYLIRTERVEPGVPLAEEQVTWPVDRWLRQARSLMQDPLIQMLQMGDESGLGDISDFDQLPFAHLDDPLDPRSERNEGDPLADRASRSAQDLVSLGKELFSALFCDSLRDSWMMAQAIAQHRQEPLRLRLGIKGEPLNRLPWEVLHDLDQPLATGTNILFSRYRPSSLYGPRPSAIAADEPLRILMVIATPIDQTELALAQETRVLLAELQHSAAAMQISLLEHPDRHTLTQALEHGNYQIFHYAGHSVSGRYGGAVSLVSEKTGLTEMLSGEDLAGLLANNGIRLAVFNSCRGAHRDSDTEISGASNLAEASIDRRIPAVLAMAERIPDDVALSLTRLFYRNLSQGVAIDLSLSRARQGLISSFGSRQLYWALPVFYLHPEFDGHLSAATDDGLQNSQNSQGSRDRAAHRSIDRSIDQSTANPRDPMTRLNFLESHDVSDTVSALDSGESGLRRITPPSVLAEAIQTDLLPDRLPDDTLLDGLTANSIAEPIDEAITLPSSDGRIDRDRRKAHPSTTHPPGLTGSASTDLARSARSQPASLTTPSNLAPNLAPNLGDETDKTSARSRSFPNAQSLRRLIHPSNPSTKTLVFGVSIAIAILGWIGWQQRPSAVRDALSVLDTPPAQEPTDRPLNAINFNANSDAELNAKLDEIVSQASTQIAANDWASALPIVEQLLDRGAVERAGSLLALIPVEALDRGDVQFLKGRWAWQTRVSGQLDASYDDAWRYWTAAVESQPDNLLYHTALGWAYYADDRLDDADRVWREAIALLDNSAKAASLSTAGSTLDRQTVELSLQAGLALTLDRRDRSDAAIALRDLILAQDALALQPPQLAQNWLWSAEAIGQWQTLLARRPVFATPPETAPN